MAPHFFRYLVYFNFIWWDFTNTPWRLKSCGRKKRILTQKRKWPVGNMSHQKQFFCCCLGAFFYSVCFLSRVITEKRAKSWHFLSISICKSNWCLPHLTCITTTLKLRKLRFGEDSQPPQGHRIGPEFESKVTKIQSLLLEYIARKEREHKEIMR